LFSFSGPASPYNTLWDNCLFLQAFAGAVPSVNRCTGRTFFLPPLFCSLNGFFSLDSSSGPAAIPRRLALTWAGAFGVAFSLFLLPRVLALSASSRQSSAPPPGPSFWRPRGANRSDQKPWVFGYVAPPPLKTPPPGSSTHSLFSPL